MPTRRKSLAIELELAKRRGKDDFYYFSKYILGYDRLVYRHHFPLCHFLTKKVEKKQGVHTIRLILMPRGTYKSTIAAKALPLWLLLQDPNKTFLVTGEKLEKTKEIIKEQKGHIEDNAKFKFFYGDWSCAKKLGRKWTDDKIDIKPRTKISGTASVQVSSWESSETGKHVDCIICDDLVGQSNVTSKDLLDKVIAYWGELGRVLNPDGEMIVIGTRWDYRELYNHILTLQKELGDACNIMLYIKAAEDEAGEAVFPEILPKPFLKQQRMTDGAYRFSCTPAETPILMADWSLKPICQVRVGDKVMGFTIASGTTKGKRSKLAVAEVLETNSRTAQVNTVGLKSGRTVRCTDSHKWYTKRSGNDPLHKTYAPAKVGKKLMLVTDVMKELSIDEISDYRYLGGIIDGEGSVGNKYISISQCPQHNPEVYREIRDVLSRLGFDWGQSEENPDTLWVRGGAETKEKLIRYARPAKAKKMLRELTSLGRYVRLEDEVVSIAPDGIEPVYALVTTTGNYVAWGYASSNCQYLNNPVNRDNALINTINKYGNEIDGEPAEAFFAKCQHFVSVDLAYTESKTSDSTAIVVNAVDRKSGKWYIRHYVVLKTSNPDVVIDLLFDVNEKFKPVRYGIEKNNYISWLKKPLEDAMRHRGVFLPIDPPDGIPHYSKEQSKPMRLRGIAPRFNFGECFIAPEMTELEDQLLTLTYDGPRGHDDLLDALAMQNEIVIWGKGAVENAYDNEEVKRESGAGSFASAWERLYGGREVDKDWLVA